MSISTNTAIVVGAGPNGLAAAITLAQAGRKVKLIEGAATLGGGCRSANLTLPGFTHDVCSAIHPMAVSSPFLRALDAFQSRVEWIYPPAALAHPLDDGTAVMLYRDLAQSAATMGVDGPAYTAMMQPFVRDWTGLCDGLLSPKFPLPKNIVALARFMPQGALPAATLARARFRGERARAVLAGLAAHSILPLEALSSAAYGLTFGASAHAIGWPLPRGGAQHITDALAAVLRELGGEIETGSWVRSLPDSGLTLLDVTPRQFLEIAGDQLPRQYQQALRRFRYGPGAFKIDYALSEPIPWTARDCAQAGTLHLGGTLDEIAASERAPWRGQHAERPFVLLAQQSLFDATRAPAGQHTAWAYCHVPNGSTIDVSAAIEAQIERFAPGFRDCILARHTHNTADLQRYNPNYIGGDIIGGVQDAWQTVMRPTPALRPYRTPVRGVYLCSSSTPPGGGVHGMCGWHAANTALRDLS